MIAVDTNILLRFVLRDDEEQFVTASSFFARRTDGDPAFVSLIVLAELAWALKQRYGFTRAEVRSLVAMLLETSEMAFEDEVSLSVIVGGSTSRRSCRPLDLPLRQARRVRAHPDLRSRRCQGHPGHGLADLTKSGPASTHVDVQRMLDTATAFLLADWQRAWYEREILAPQADMP